MCLAWPVAHAGKPWKIQSLAVEPRLPTFWEPDMAGQCGQLGRILPVIYLISCIIYFYYIYIIHIYIINIILYEIQILYYNI